MENVTIHQAETNLSQLLSRVERGEEIVISDQGVPIAKLIRFQASSNHQLSSNRRASLGMDRGKITIPEDFNDPLPDDSWNF